MHPWEEYRERHLKRYREALARGEVDVPIVPVLELLNASPHYVTTSSCSGRIVLLGTSREERKEDSWFHRKWHRPVRTEELLQGVRGFRGDYLWLKVDPFILHVGADTLERGYELVKTARSAGVKVAGIQSIKEWGVHVEIRNIENMAVPVVWEGKTIVDEGFLRRAVHIANLKMVKNQARLEKFYEALLKLFNS